MTEECPLCGVHLDVELPEDPGCQAVCDGCVNVAEGYKEALVQSITKLTEDGEAHATQAGVMMFMEVAGRAHVQFKVIQEAAIRLQAAELGGT